MLTRTFFCVVKICLFRKLGAMFWAALAVHYALGHLTEARRKRGATHIASCAVSSPARTWSGLAYGWTHPGGRAWRGPLSETDAVGPTRAAAGPGQNHASVHPRHRVPKPDSRLGPPESGRPTPESWLGPPETRGPQARTAGGPTEAAADPGQSWLAHPRCGVPTPESLLGPPEQRLAQAGITVGLPRCGVPKLEWRLGPPEQR